MCAEFNNCVVKLLIRIQLFDEETFVNHCQFLELLKLNNRFGPFKDLVVVGQSVDFMLNTVILWPFNIIFSENTTFSDVFVLKNVQDVKVQQIFLKLVLDVVINFVIVDVVLKHGYQGMIAKVAYSNFVWKKHHVSS